MKTPVSTHPCQHSLCLLPQDLLNAENVKTTQQTDFGAILSDPSPFVVVFGLLFAASCFFFYFQNNRKASSHRTVCIVYDH